MKIVAIADTHGMHDKITIPDGDVLIHAGDFTSHGTQDNLYDFCRWLKKLPHRHKIVIAGNHDKIAADIPLLVESTLYNAGATYLQDKSTTIDGIKFYGSPWTPTFMNWHFMADRGATIAAKWKKIPDETDVLITHGPPFGIGDRVNGLPQGCENLLNKVQSFDLMAHVYGHIHEGYGLVETMLSPYFINASVCDSKYSPSNKPIWFEI